MPKDLPILGRLWSNLSAKSRKQGEVGLAVVDDEPPCGSTSTMTATTDMERVFRYFDEDGDGKISPAELRSCMRAAGEELSAEEAAAVVESSDSDGDGMLGVEEFVRMVEAEGEAERGRNLREAFEMYAVQGKKQHGEKEEEEEWRITARSLRRMLRRLGESRTVVECQAMIREFDLNGDGVLSFDEFKIMMH
ncbi:putative calcium-binding protein CML19 [Curcuma longa]|uniref:putative calcium-binding protein CML19 n=1 Tax=Curcuma longa TaxID=136217 RepID=UPI003D9E4ABF